MGRKLSQNEVEDIFIENGCKLLDEYKGARISMKYICECGNISTISLDNFKRGKRCKECGLKKLAEQLTMIDFAKEYLNNNHHWILYDIDNNLLQNSEGVIECNFGELQRMRKDKL